MRIVILGAPGSGKRTQTALLSEKYGLSSVMTGELVKDAVLQRTSLGIEIKELQDAGRVVTEDIILALLREHLLKREFQEGFILDGFPRNLLQALTLDELMIEIDQPIDLILLIDIETDTLMERLVGRRTCRSCGLLYNIYRHPPIVDGVCDVCGGRLHLRSDDNEETVSNRIHVFDHLIAPLITHYEKQGKLVRIDGNGEVSQVFQLICEAIAEGGRVEAPIAPQAVTEELPVKREESLVAEEPAEGFADEDVTSASAENSKVVEKKPPARSKVVKKASPKRSAAKKTAKKQAGKKKPVTQPASASRAVKKKSAKKKVIRKQAPKDKVVSKKKASIKKKSTKPPAKTKAKGKTASARKSSKTSAKSSRSSARQSGKVVKKSAKKSVTAKATVKKAAKKAGLKKTAAKRSSGNKSALKKAKSKKGKAKKN